MEYIETGLAFRSPHPTSTCHQDSGYISAERSRRYKSTHGSLVRFDFSSSLSFSMADAKPTDAKPAEPTTGITKSTAETGTVAKSPATTTPTYDLKKVLDHVYDTQQVCLCLPRST